MFRTVKNQERGTIFLYSAFEELKKEFKIDKSRKFENVAVRAAFCYVMKNSKSFTLEQVAAPLGFGHASVLHLVKKCEWGTYDSSMTYHKAIEFCSNMLLDETSQVLFETQNAPKATKRQERRLVNSLKRDKNELSKLFIAEKARSESMLIRLNKLNNYWQKIERGVKEADSRMRTLGFYLIDREQLEKLEKNLKAHS